MTIVTKKPPIKETVGAQYICFDVPDTAGAWTPTFESNVEKTEVVKSVNVTENAEQTDIYSSGIVYDSEKGTVTSDIAVSVIAFEEATLAKMRGDKVDNGGLILRGGNGERAFFAYGKIVKLKGGKVRMDWYPKCKLTENTDQADTKEDTYSEQTDDLTIRAFPFDDDGNNVVSVHSDVNFPEWLTEDLFFSRVIMTKEDLASLQPTTTNQNSLDDGE